MSDKKKVEIEPLELNNETLRDLSEQEAERVEGGAYLIYPAPVSGVCPGAVRPPTMQQQLCNP